MGAPGEPGDDDPWLSHEDFEHYRKAPGALYGTAIPPLSEDMRRTAYEQCLSIVDSHRALLTEVERLRGAAADSEDDEARAWAERTRAVLTEVLDADEVARVKGQAGCGPLSAQMIRLVCDSHEKLRAAAGSPPPTPAPEQVLWEGETRMVMHYDPRENGTTSFIPLPLEGFEVPPGTHVVVVERTALANASPPAPDPGAFDAEQLVVILGLADLDPLERAGEPPVRCALCGAEAPGGATTLAPSQHLGGCLWVSARELAKVLRAKSP